MFLVCKVVDAVTGIPYKELPDWQTITISPVFSDVGTITGQYPNGGINANLLTPDTELAWYIDGIEVPDTRCWIDEHDIDESGIAEDNELITIASSTGLSQLTFVTVYPSDWPTSSNPPSHSFINATPGKIMNDLFAKARGRGAIGMTRVTQGAWDANHDSNGSAWGDHLTIVYDAETKYLDVLTSLVAQNVVEVRMNGRVLDLYRPGTLGVDRTLGAKPVVFRRGENLTDSPRKTSLKDLANTVLVAGDQNVYIEVSDPTSVALRGRREGAASAGTITDLGTLAVFGQGQILLSREKVEKTCGLVFTEGVLNSRPLIDFNLGDWVLSDNSSGTYERLRIKQWSITQQITGNMIGSVSLNDLIDEWAEKVNRYLTGLINGSTTPGPSQPPGGTEHLAPAAPAAVTIGSAVYTDSRGREQAQITIMWAPVTTNADGTPCTDLAGYEPQYTVDGSAGTWTPMGLTGDLAAFVSPFDLNIGVTARVRSVDTSGNRSPWTLSDDTLTAVDNTPPPTPSRPTVTTRLGTITVGWNGLGSANEAMPLDFNHVNVYGAPSTAGVLVDPANYLGVIVLGRGSLVVSGLPYDTAYSFVLTSVDTSGNESLASPLATTQTVALVDTDLIGSIIDGAHIVDGTIVASEKILARSVTADEIAALSITAGEIAANAIEADKIAVGAVTAEKVQLGVLSTNLMVNPGFEDLGDLVPTPNTYFVVPGWTLAASAGASATAWVEYAMGAQPSRSGAGKAVLPCAGGQLGSYILSDPIAVLSGQDYVFSAQVSGRGKVRMRLQTGPAVSGPWAEQADGIEDLLVDQTADGSYVVLKIDKTVPIAHSFVRFVLYNYNSGATGFFPANMQTLLAVDDVSLTRMGFGATELTGAGLRMFDEFGNETMNLTGAGAGGNYLTIQRGGQTQVSLDSNGDVAASGIVSAGQGLVVDGTDFFSWLDTLAGGAIAWANRPTGSAAVAVETAYLELEFTAQPGRLYKICTGPIVGRAAVAGYITMRMRHTSASAAYDGTDASTLAPAVGTSSTQIAGHNASTPIANVDFNLGAFTYILDTGSASVAYDHRVLITFVTGSQGGNCLIDANSTQTTNLWVDDDGPSIADTGIDRIGGGPSTKKNHVVAYNASWTHDYEGDNTPTSWTGDDALVQGYYSSGHGNQRSMIGLPYAAIEAALTGATSISKVEVYLWYYEWYSSKGTAVIGYHASTASSAPATFSGAAAKLAFGNWPRNYARWVDITTLVTPTAWATGAARGLVIGPGTSTSSVYYGKAYGASHSGRPQIRFTYVK